MINDVSWIPKGVSRSKSPSDSVFVTVGILMASHGILQVWVFDEEKLKWFVHRDFILIAFPLSVAWFDCPETKIGNYLAVGTLQPPIEIWDIDSGDKEGPSVVLEGHTDSVIDLAWNKEYRNTIASAGGDSQVKIWDVVAQKCDITMDHHSNEVLAVAWNHHAPQVLLSGSYDKTVVLKDVRMPSHSGYKWSVTAGVERLAWDPHTEHSFVVSQVDGSVHCFDDRTAAKSNSTSELNSTFTLHAHDKSVSSICYNPLAPNLLATGSLDRTVKLWDLSNNQPTCVASQNPGLADVRCISFSEDSPFMLAIGGRVGEAHIWNTLSDPTISGRYEKYNK